MFESLYYLSSLLNSLLDTPVIVPKNVVNAVKIVSSVSVFSQPKDWPRTPINTPSAGKNNQTNHLSTS